MPKGKVTITGGKKLEKLLKEAGKGGVKAIDVGFFPSAKYPDGTPVAYVAAINEFGVTFTHPGGTPYKIINGKAVFVKKGTPGIAGITKAHLITIPERPAIRIANKENQKVLSLIIKKNIDPKKMIVDKKLAGLLGASQQSAIQKSIVNLKDPPNTASTIRQKGGKANPLVNTGFEVRSVTFKVIE
jgi:hypothetical protein